MRSRQLWCVKHLNAEQHVLHRCGPILEPDTLGKLVADLVSDPCYTRGVAYGFRADADIMPLDLEATGKRAGDGDEPCSANF